MTPKRFEKLADVNRLKGKTREAVRMVLVDGESGYAAANACQIAESTVSRALARMRREICPSCKQPIKE